MAKRKIYATNFIKRNKQEIVYGGVMRVNALNKETQEKFVKALPIQYSLIWRIGAHTGLRISDIVCLEKSVLNQKYKTIRAKKTNKPIRISLPKKLKEDLKLWCNRDYNSKKSNYIFYSSRSKSTHIERIAVFKNFKKVAKEMKLPQNIGTHSMRHTYATMIYKKYKGNLFEVQKRLQHSNINDTLLYLIDENGRLPQC